MKEYRFTEAAPLISFIEVIQGRIIGKRLKNLYVDFWPDYGGHASTASYIILELDFMWIVIDYRVPSDMTIRIGSREEIKQDRFVAETILFKDESEDYYDSPYECAVKKEDIDGCKINKISVYRFSNSFQSNFKGETRPEGGDYFSTIRLYLDSGTTLCFCGASAICDGYTDIWCE